MSAARSQPWSWSALLVTGAAASLPVVLPGCGIGLAKPGGAAVNYSFTLPAARAPRPPLSADDAALVYPDVDHLGRDPFLTIAEQTQYDGKTDLAAATPDTPPPVEPEQAATPVKVRRHPKGETLVETVKPALIRALHQQVRGIILGKHNTFAFQGKLYEEGDWLPGNDWQVISITELAIHLKSKDGQSDILNFTRTAPQDDKGGGGGLIIEFPGK
jgi:hypothetical protein